MDANFVFDPKNERPAEDFSNKNDKLVVLKKVFNTAQKMKFSIKDFFSNCDQILKEKLHFLCILS